MKSTILLTVATAFVATAFAAPKLLIRDTPVGANECGFFAAVNFAQSSGGFRHCWIEVVLPPVKGESAPPCPKIASTFISGPNTPSCFLLSQRECSDSKGLGVQGRFCSGYNSKVSLVSDSAVAATLKNCLVELKMSGTDPKTWKAKCESGKAPKYDTFKDR